MRNSAFPADTRPDREQFKKNDISQFVAVGFATHWRIAGLLRGMLAINRIPMIWRKALREPLRNTPIV
ncbi:hypothetical protein [Herbaspirillum sp. CF444]|uniref:hypothetical protein n=1 Tax=Herbaspirillum sp. CF444 TaxID=1144319 RepID=UPI0002D695CF|nr:hypothetical protein [Herbaspirillum sp. CF444]